MAGDGAGGQHDSQLLVEETRRVLDAQQQLVRHQRNRATSAIRIILSACGLLLTLVSLGITQTATREPAGVPGLGSHAGGLERTITLALLATVSFLTCRMLCAALVVLEPRTATHPVAAVLTNPVFGSERPVRLTGESATSFRFDGPPALRAGVDAEAAADLSETPNPYRAVLAYNAGCVAGNALVARHNRWYLTRVYRSAVLVVVLVTATIVAGLLLYGP